LEESKVPLFHLNNDAENVELLASIVDSSGHTSAAKRLDATIPKLELM
jgi:hypothetical protein